MSEETNATAKKPFFKSVSFKCIVVLLVIALVSGIFLTFCNALFYVSDEERLLRALGKLYDGETLTAEDYNTEEVDDSIIIDDATINAVYAITNENHAGDYIIDVTGAGGYQSGTVTCYVIINITDSTLSVGKITISSNTSQSFISNISSSALDSFSAVYGVETTNTDEYYVLYTETDGFYTDDANNVTNHLETGATYSMGAVCNAVNGAVKYMKAMYLGIITINQYDSFNYTAYIDKDATEHTVSDGEVTYTVVTKNMAPALSFTITIVVDSTETITSYEITNNGSTYDPNGTYYGDKMYTGSYVGMGADDLLELLDVENNKVSSSELKTGASLSNYLCAYAALFAAANYQNCIDAEVGE